MARAGNIRVKLDVDTSEWERKAEGLLELALLVDLRTAPYGSQQAVDASHRYWVFCAKRSLKLHRRYADRFGKWDPRRWKALWHARRCERELAEAGEGK